MSRTTSTKEATTAQLVHWQKSLNCRQMATQLALSFPVWARYTTAAAAEAAAVVRATMIPVPFDRPADDFTVLIGDWYSKDHIVLRRRLDRGRSLGRPAGVLINGKKNDPKPLFTMEAGKVYRFRICNVGMKTSLNFRIQGHDMMLVEMDGSHTVQNAYESLDVHAGQCYSVLVTANQEPRGYYIMVASTRFIKKPMTTTAVVGYAGSSEEPSPELPEAPVGWAWSVNQWRSFRWNLTASAARPNPQGSYHYGGINITRTIRLCNSAGSTVDGKLRYAINGASFQHPKTPLKLAEYFGAGALVFQYDTIGDVPPATLGSMMIRTEPVVLKATFRDFVEIILENPEKAIQSYHLDGYSFFLVGWWTGLGLIESLPFSRDRLVENYMWSVGIAFEPQYSNVRVWLTKLICVLTVIDDVYDVYGSLGELELFTNAVERWKPEAAEMLPEYMKPCFLALHGLVNETAREISRNIQGWDAMPFVRKEWQRLCKGYLLEAKWFNNCYKPTLTKYLENAWITIGGSIVMVHCYLLRPIPIPHKLADCLSSNQALKLIYVSSLITRISDDLGTSKAEMERGDTSKTLDCFMEEWGESEDNAREHIKGLVGELWRELNEECHRINSAGELPRDFIRMVVNMSRAAQCVFQYGDGIGTSTGITKDRIISLFVEGIE